MAGPAQRLADAILRLAAALAPRADRGDLQREWRAELAWAAGHGRRGRPHPVGHGPRLVLRAAGAVVHAAWLRWDRWRPDTMLDDVRSALRALRDRPLFTGIAVLTLAIGIGANAAVFSAVHAVLLRPLPFADGVVRLFQVLEDRRVSEASAPDFVDWRAASRSLDAMAAYTSTSLALTGEGEAEQLPAATVTGDFFRVLGVQALHGRILREDDTRPGAPAAAVISQALWARRFGADPRVVGRRVVLDGTPFEIAGVLADASQFPLHTDLWVPLIISDEQYRTQRGAHYLDVIGHLAPGMTPDQADAEVRTIGGRLAAAYPKTNRGTTVSVVPFRDALVGDVRPALLMLLGAVGVVLLIACGNLATLLMTRALGRGRELAVRAALGADRARLVRALLIESLVVALLGAAGGVVLAAWAAAGVAALEPATAIPWLDTVHVDRSVLAFCAALALATAAAFGILPALRVSGRLDIAGLLHAAGRAATTDRGSTRLRGTLIVLQTALAVVLLVGAGLLVRSFERLLAVELGFRTDGLLTFAVSLPSGPYATPERRAAAVSAIVDAARGVPGATGAAAVFGLPLTDFSYGITTRAVDGRLLSDDEQDRTTLQVRVVSPDYFRLLGIPLRAGRAFAASDHDGAAPAAIVSDSAARLLWPERGDVLGRSLEIGSTLGQGRDRRAGGTVVGVVADVHHAGPAARTRPTLYLSHAQWPLDSVAIVVGADGDPARLAPVLRERLQAIDRDLPMFRVRTMAQLADGVVARPALYMRLLGAFGLAAAALAALGLYGVLAHVVSLRTREIAVRLALGATRAAMVRVVVTHGLALAGAGTVGGLFMAVLATRTLEGLLFSLPHTDAVTYASVAGAVLLVAAAATWLPARRASRVHPIDALRGD